MAVCVWRAQMWRVGLEGDRLQGRKGNTRQNPTDDV